MKSMTLDMLSLEGPCMFKAYVAPDRSVNSILILTGLGADGGGIPGGMSIAIC